MAVTTASTNPMTRGSRHSARADCQPKPLTLTLSPMGRGETSATFIGTVHNARPSPRWAEGKPQRPSSALSTTLDPLPDGERGNLGDLHLFCPRRSTVHNARRISPCETFEAPAIRSSKVIGTSNTG